MSSNRLGSKAIVINGEIIDFTDKVNVNSKSNDIFKRGMIGMSGPSKVSYFSVLVRYS